MTVEKYANQAETTLAAGINNAVTVLTVASSAGFPAVTTALAQQFRIRVEPAIPDGSHEWMAVTNIAGVTWTVVRAQDGSAASAWASGARVTAVLTRDSLFPKGAANLSFLNPVTDFFLDAEVTDDGVNDSSTWRDRLRASFRTALGVSALVQWWNEYFELRLCPAKSNTVALRIFVKNNPADPTHTGMVLEITDNRTDRNTLAGFDSLGNVVAVNLGIQLVAGSVAPADHSKGWINLAP